MATVSWREAQRTSYSSVCLGGHVANSRAYFTALAVLLSTACHKSQGTPSFNYARNVGVAVRKADRFCLDIHSNSLSSSQRIKFISTSTPPSTGEAEIVRQLDQSCAGAQSEVGQNHYEFRVISGSLERGAPAFVLVDFAGALNTTGTAVAADLNADGQLDFFRSCTSSEGVHLTIWQGKPLIGIRKWHSYYYLGFDVEPTCTPADTEADTK
jgi:hypothetical protein